MATIHEITEDWQREGLSPTWVKLQAAQAEFDRLQEQVIDLEVEVRRLRVFYQADAERYRSLRRGQKWSVTNGIGDSLRAEELDAAIDAAMKGE